MVSEWEEFSLADLYEVSSGLSKPAKDFGSGYPFLSFKDVFNNFFVPNELKQLVQSSKKEQSKCSIKRGDVFLTRTSETMHELGMSSVSLKDYEKATFNGFTKRLRPKTNKKIIPEFIGYYLRSPMFRQEMLAFSTMSTRASLNNEMISRLKITLPPEKTQSEIAHILKSLDDKIELNKKINQTLEQMAQAMFKSWFVDFDPVFDNLLEKHDNNLEKSSAYLTNKGAEDLIPKLQQRHQIQQTSDYKPLPDHTRKEFPNDFQHHEDMGWIPERWGVLPLDKIANYQNGLALQKFRPKDESEFLPVVKIAQLKKGCADGDEKASPNIKPECIIDDGDVIFSWSGSLIVDMWYGGKAALNQHLFKVTSTEHPKWFYYFFTKHHLKGFQKIAKDKAVTMGHIKRSHLSEALCLIPNQALTDLATEHLKPLLTRQGLVSLNISKLNRLKDLLLPKLINGELKIGN